MSLCVNSERSFLDSSIYDLQGDYSLANNMRLVKIGEPCTKSQHPEYSFIISVQTGVINTSNDYLNILVNK